METDSIDIYRQRDACWPKSQSKALFNPTDPAWLYDDECYAACILSARICLGLLSKGNRDLHTTRSLEIPVLGGLLCAERTSEHLALYEDGKEAVFWDDADECAARCLELLDDAARCLSIARAGHARAVRNHHFNEPVVAAILAAAFERAERRYRDSRILRDW